jgi:hypothetical protein
MMSNSKGGRATNAAPRGVGENSNDGTIIVDRDEVIRAFDDGLYRVDVKQTFAGWLLSKYGRFGAQAARRELVRELHDGRGLTSLQIAEELDISYSTIREDVRAVTGTKRAYRRNGSDTVEQERQRERRRARKGIGDRHAESLYAAMCNAPRNAVSIPMMNRASEVVQTLAELSVLDPEVAASQVAGVRVREYSGASETLEWWEKFIAACEKRRAEEFPTLLPLKCSTVWTPKGRLNGAIARSVLDLLAERGRATEAEIGAGLATPNIGKVLRGLVDDGRITIDAEGFYEAQS